MLAVRLLHLRAECSDNRRPHRRCFTTWKNDCSSADWLFRPSFRQERSSSSMNGSIPSSVCRVAFIQQRLLPGGFGNLQFTVHWVCSCGVAMAALNTQVQTPCTSFCLQTVAKQYNATHPMSCGSISCRAVVCSSASISETGVSMTAGKLLTCWQSSGNSPCTEPVSWSSNDVPKIHKQGNPNVTQSILPGFLCHSIRRMHETTAVCCATL
jgi:hypothetical protein